MKLGTLFEGVETKQDVHDVISLVKSAKSANEIRENTRGFALENDDGSIVKVFVRADQADEFEAALSKALYDGEEEGIEIPEILFNLRKNFEIVDVEWGEKSIPEDEEESKELKPKNDKSNDDEMDDLDLSDEGGEEGDDGLPPPDGESDELPPADDLPPVDPSQDMMGGMGGEEGGEEGGEQDKLMGAITQVMDMLKADAEAKKAEANARKAEAEAKIASETNKAASLRASQEEEVLDMEDYNKQKDSDKKMGDTRDKLIKYRHDVKNSKSELGESMNSDQKKFPDASQEEEEVLDMEKWEAKKKEREQAKKTRERLLKFRHAKKTHGGKKDFKTAVGGMAKEGLEKIRSVGFAKFNTLIEQQLNEDYDENGVRTNTQQVAKQIFGKMKASKDFKGYLRCSPQQIQDIVDKYLKDKIKSDNDRKHIAVELVGMLQDVKDQQSQGQK